MRIKDKIKRPRRPVVVYEILPPREKDGTLNSYAANISSLLSQTHIDAIIFLKYVMRLLVGRGQ